VASRLGKRAGDRRFGRHVGRHMPARRGAVARLRTIALEHLQIARPLGRERTHFEELGADEERENGDPGQAFQSEPAPVFDQVVLLIIHREHRCWEDLDQPNVRSIDFLRMNPF
jgi:hypothetical protein